jgi:nicotinate (nicotinamide) nucleotide adenylyltransferase
MPLARDIVFCTMQRSDPSQIIETARLSGKPDLHFISRAEPPGRNLGVFPASFNPVTTAHIELLSRAANEFSLDEVLALAGTSNADKSEYDCLLDDRLRMLQLALVQVPNASIGICSTPFFVDMIEAAIAVYPPDTQLSFILGIDTFVRVLDLDGKYVQRYQKPFTDRSHALEYLLSKSRLIVAERSYPGRPDVDDLLSRHPGIKPSQVQLMDFPLDFSERSATEVRDALRSGRSIAGLVPPAVENYIHQHRLYGATS